MDDRALLEAAAKAAGIVVGDWLPGMGLMRYEGGPDSAVSKHRWNPLTDDGDALRLAVKLNLTITPYPIYEDPKHSVIVLCHQNLVNQLRTPYNPSEVVETYGTDPYAATRRAIVRAAASIGDAT